jgi:hypothetical protein
MNENPEPSLIDCDQLKREITAAVRAVIQERADELGISYEACVGLFFDEEALP